MREAGVDEAGRGPLAGPVVAAAVILPPDYPAFKDSKQLSATRRGELASWLEQHAIYSIGLASVAEIERLNILQATLLAMQRAVLGLAITPTRVLVDGPHCPKLAIPTQGIIQGDSLIPAISAASILAKVRRDNLMQQLDAEYPDYGFAQHKGYGTRHHLAALKRYGITPSHRKTFGPIKALL